MNQQINLIPGAGIRTCRVCKAQFVGHGALCPTHAAELAAQIAQANIAASAVLQTRTSAQQAERRARPRSEWRERV